MSQASQFKKVSQMIGKATGYIALFIAITAIMDFWRGQDLPKAAIPSTNYQSIQKQVFNLSEASNDQLTVVYFWATWCGPCKITSPSIKQLAKHYPVITIAMASGDDQELKTYFSNETSDLKDQSNTLQHRIPIINDNNQSIAKEWGVSVTPTVLFIKNKTVLGHTMGASGLPGLWARAKWLDIRS